MDNGFKRKLNLNRGKPEEEARVGKSRTITISYALHRALQRSDPKGRTKIGGWAEECLWQYLYAGGFLDVEDKDEKVGTTEVEEEEEEISDFARNLLELFCEGDYIPVIRPGPGTGIAHKEGCCLITRLLIQSKGTNEKIPDILGQEVIFPTFRIASGKDVRIPVLPEYREVMDEIFDYLERHYPR